MTSSSATFRTLLPTLKHSLQSFLSSSSTFQVIRTVSPSRLPSTVSAPHASTIPNAPSIPPRTLFILDSSFNPPSLAHLTIALAALTSQIDLSKYPKPHRLLLLFAVQNADKNPGPALFEHRLAMMTLFATDLLTSLMQKRAEEGGSLRGEDEVDVDVGITTKPYYTDKSEAIEQTGWYAGDRGNAGDAPMHVHLAGFDTFTRIFTAKYYKDHDPPLSALKGYFGKHRLRITYRLDDEFGTKEDQNRYLRGIAEGEMDADGAEAAWADQIEFVDEGEGVGISSTKVRQAVKNGDWEEVERLVTPSVAAWMQEQRLYTEE